MRLKQKGTTCSIARYGTTCQRSGGRGKKNVSLKPGCWVSWQGKPHKKWMQEIKGWWLSKKWFQKHWEQKDKTMTQEGVIEHRCLWEHWGQHEQVSAFLIQGGELAAMFIQQIIRGFLTNSEEYLHITRPFMRTAWRVKSQHFRLVNLNLR